MTEAPQWFIRTEKPKQDPPVACALTLQPRGSIPLSVTRLSWSEDVTSMLQQIARAGRESKMAEGKSLPYASLRAALQVQLPEALLLASDLGIPRRSDARPWPLLDVPIRDGRDPARLAAQALRTWCRSVLREWAERIEIDEILIDALDDRSTATEAFSVQTLEVDLAEELAGGHSSFDTLRNGILQLLAMRLEGQELFEGLGPVYRIIRRNSRANELSFQTWPVEAHGGLYSMVANLSVETAPYLDRPLVTVKASRRCWLPRVPDEKKRLYGRSSISGYLMAREAPFIAVHYEVPVESRVGKREVQKPFSPEYMIHALSIPHDLAVDFSEAVERGASDEVFVGLAYSTTFDGSHPVKSGASTRDVLDLLRAIHSLVAEDGFDVLPGFQAEENKKAPKRSEEVHKAMAINAMLADVAFSLGHNDLSDEALQDACSNLMEGLEVTGVKPKDALEAREKLEEVRQANIDRLERTYGNEKPTLAVIARTERERHLMRACIKGLFGQGVKVVSHPLPKDTHGPKPLLPLNTKKSAERFGARVEAWKPLAEHLAANHAACHALVQAPDWFEGGKDDRVNKLAGRYALAVHANANVQFLLPPQKGKNGPQHYLHRAQSALYDLLFGHAALVSEIKSLLEGAFPDPATRPRAILGISVIKQSRIRGGGQGGEVVLATRVDATTGRTQARVGWFQGRMVWSETWEPFFEAMKRIASPEVTGTLGGEHDVKRASFQAFVKEMMKSSVEAGDRPLVLIDSTSAAGLWSWLTDAEIGSKVRLGREGIDMATQWKGARIVRVRTKRAGHLVIPKTSKFAPIDPDTGEIVGDSVEVRNDTVSASTVRISQKPDGSGTHYWVTPSYSFKVTRGLSVYRTIEAFANGPKGWKVEGPDGKAYSPRRLLPMDRSDKPYKLPGVIDVTVAMIQEGDNPDLIARLVASLKEGYGHSQLPTTLPAPLSFESKVRDYMTRFELEEADQEDQLEEGEESDPSISDEASLEDVEDLEEEDLDDPDPEETAPTAAEDDDEPKRDETAENKQQDPVKDGGVVSPHSRVSEDASLSERRRARDLDEYLTSMISGGTGTSREWLTSVSSSVLTAVSKRPAPRADGKAAKSKNKEVQEARGRRMGSDSVKKDKGAQEAGDDRQPIRELSYLDNWPKIAKGPVLPVPDFFTKEWLRDKVSAPESMRRRLHQFADNIRALSGYPWPEERPTDEEFLDLLIDGARYPGFIKSVSLVARSQKKKTQRFPFLIFQPYHKVVARTLGRLERQEKSKVGLSDFKGSARLFIANEQPHHAMGMAYIHCLCTCYFPGFLELAEEHPEVYGPLQEFLEAASIHLDSSVFAGPDPTRKGGSSDGSAEKENLSSLETSSSHEAEDYAWDDSGESDVEEEVNEQDVGEGGPSAVREACDGDDGGGDDTEVGGPQMTDMEAFLQEWRSALETIASSADKAALQDPSQAEIEVLRNLLKVAEQACIDWDEAQPKHVEAAPLASEIADLEAEANELLDEDQRGEPLKIDFDIARVSKDAARTITTFLDEARDAVAKAQEASQGARELAKSFATTGRSSLLDESKALQDQAKEQVASGLKVLERAASQLAEGAVHDTPPPPEPTSGPDGKRNAGKTAAAEQKSSASKRPQKDEQTRSSGEPETFLDYEEPGDEYDSALELLAEQEDDEDPEPVDPGYSFDAPNSTRDEARAHKAEAEAEPALTEPPLVGRIREKLTALVGAGEYGLAHHLLHAAARSYPERPFEWSEPELRLVAIAPHINHATMMGSEDLGDLLEETRESVNDLDGAVGPVPHDVLKARSLLLYGATSAIALFHHGSAARETLRSLPSVDPLLNPLLHKMREEIISGSQRSITPVMFRMASRKDEEFQHEVACREQILKQVQTIEHMSLKAALGSRIKTAICQSSGPVGELKSVISGDGVAAVSAAKAFAESYERRGDITNLLERTEESLSGRKQGLHGGVRDRLVDAILLLAASCKEFAEAHEARPQLQDIKRLRIVHSTRDSILSPLSQLLEKLKDLKQQTSFLVANAADYTARCLVLLQGLLEGKISTPETNNQLVALYGPLLWLPGLQFGRSWLPSPYSPEAIVGAILNAPVPLLEPDVEPEAALVAAAEQRLKEDSFVAARLLAESATFYGAPAEVGDSIRQRIESEIPVRQEAMISSMDQVTRQVDRIQRMGLLQGVDAAQTLLFKLGRIDVQRLPADPREEPLTEEESEDQVLDFAAAEIVIEDLRDQVEEKLEKRRSQIRDRLAEHIAECGREDHQVAMIRGLIDEDDLLTAEEYLGFLKNGQELPKSAHANQRFLDFFPEIPRELSRRGKQYAELIPESIRNAEDLGPLNFSRIREDRREQMLAIFSDWRELRARVRGGHQQEHVNSLLSSLLEEMGLPNEILGADRALTNTRQQTYAVDMKLDLPMDGDRLLLPDFGSVARGHYRVCLVQRMPSDSELEKLSAGTGSSRVIVFVMDPIDELRRNQLAAYCIKQSLRVLVVDEALLLYALSEPEFRPLTLFECAQPFSLAAPFDDYGNRTVPPEMFFGREIEKRKIFEPSGSCIVYGGRRLGKTALLLNVKEEKHQPENGVIVAYVNLHELGTVVQTGQVWQNVSLELREIFKEPVSEPRRFSNQIKSWLDADPRRQVLVLFDETDRFIEADAAQSYQQFLHLRQLMDTTHRRFKFVLAGLHNVTRLVNSENPPLKHIASDPQRIGPLMDDELGEAEKLVTRPLAAMGYEFDNREDVWRILSHCNYYPVLIQKFCKGLLEGLHRDVVKQQKPIFNIDSERVREALENERIAKEIEETFEFTIAIDKRYRLIANIMGQRALRDAEVGRTGEGMTAVEVLDVASSYWPTAFRRSNRISTVEDLLDEMEGLGVLRRVAPDAWSLRSHTVLRLLGNEAKIEAVLTDFLTQPPPPAFDPRSMRRPLPESSQKRWPKDYRCPFTLGQEHDLLSDSASRTKGVHIWAIFGNELSDVDNAAAAMLTSDQRDASGNRMKVEAQIFRTREDLQQFVRVKRSERTLIMVDRKTPWDGNWIDILLRQRAVRDGDVRIALVGGPHHALKWVTDQRLQPPPAGVKAMTLQTWSDAMIDESLKRENLPENELHEKVRVLTGGYNKPANELFLGSTNSKQFAARLEKIHKRFLTSKSLLGDIGVGQSMEDIFRLMPKTWINEGCTSIYEVREGILPEVKNPLGLNAQQVVHYGVLVGFLDPHPLEYSSEDDRSYALNPLLLAALAPEGAEEVMA